MIHLNLGFDITWLILAILLTMVSGAIAGMITGEKMSWSSIWNSALITSFIPLVFLIFVGPGLLWLAIILTNVGLFFILPTWWVPEDVSKKTYCYLVFLMFNTVLGIAVVWLMQMITNGAV